jgi:hypothetical protein
MAASDERCQRCLVHGLNLLVQARSMIASAAAEPPEALKPAMAVAVHEARQLAARADALITTIEGMTKP